MGIIMEKKSKIYVAGHTGLVGSAIVKQLRNEGYLNLLLSPHKELDLINQQQVNDFFYDNKPEYVFLCAGKVGGIAANNYQRGDFIYKNLMIQSNVIHAASKNAVSKLMCFGSSCVYPRNCPQPIKEDYLLSDKLEMTNEPYAISKIAAIKMCESYRAQFGLDAISVMPTNLYGEGDNYDILNSHVLPALIRKFHEAKKTKEDEVIVWGTGKPLREFMYIKDLADACIFLMNNYDGKEIINIGTGEDISIFQLSELIRRIVGYEGKVIFDTNKPDGTPKKLLDVSKLNGLGWQHKYSLEDGISATYKNYIKNAG